MLTAPIKPVVLVVLDGVGIAHDDPGNAVTKAHTPFLEKIWDSYPHTMLHASGEHVGLPLGIKGNSEVGHMNLGGGRVVYQELPRINKAIEKGLFQKNTQLLEALFLTQHTGSRLHAAVCFSDAGVHGTIHHLEALIETAKQHNMTQPLIIHAFTDGRDSPPKSAHTFFTVIQSVIDKNGIGTFGSVMGRYYAMDRNQVWERVKRAYDALTTGTGHSARTWNEALENAYLRGETDEFIEPTLIRNDRLDDPTIREGDTCILLNYRADRSIELTSALTQTNFTSFERTHIVKPLHFVGMTEYAKGIPANVAFPSDDLPLPLGRILSEYNQRQLRIAESEKYPHVTYFFNGGRSIPFPGEDRIHIPSPNVNTYDQKPEMSLPEVTRVLVNKLSMRVYDFILINIANGDMVGHTGNLDAGIRAMQSVDHALKEIVSAATAIGGAVIITADHGNIEEMRNLETGAIDTEHSDNPVPFIYISQISGKQAPMLKRGSLANVAPTVLSLLGLKKPSTMKGTSLITR